ncbi:MULTISPECIES: CoA pyrophosphatase [unclassified Agarivorans]|uniref:CoA pyrophosphatase n=1 Tax=unclassified Agarivorans TaxID=2636026 RepID=UPI0026E1BB7A|nr:MULTISPECIES: CoA pyrophosphatase [unclassified Agarivorans]MDO6686074.1 CoA pyrophosphatase [Agarivorans sp. 3_MG-2023]MDO6713788.1 CoA pyrophosphatase [Agarivorans sp. 2_MG-2023]
MPVMQHYLQRFLLQLANTDSQRSAKHAAAVLLPIISQQGEEDRIVLTERSAHLRHHPSQISLPGGKQDPKDINLAHTALRETEEEIGIPAHVFTLHGQLPRQTTVSNFAVRPFIATTSEQLLFKLNQDEVAQVMVLPLRPFLQLTNYHSYRFTRNGHKEQVYFIKVDKHVIWGATAKILRDFAIQCCR